MESYVDQNGETVHKFTANERAAMGLPPGKTPQHILDLPKLVSDNKADRYEPGMAQEKAQPGGAIDSFLAGAIGDTSHSHPGLAQGGANMAGNLARDFAIISAITIAAICLLRFLARRLRERTGLTVTDAPKKLGALWVKFQRDE
jgi:hypothetical protein